MRKEGVYSFILNLMKRIEYSRESQFNKINKILFLTIYYNIFESKYSEVIKEDSDDKQVQDFIDNFLVEEDKNIEEIMEENDFKKIEESSILKYKEAKESIENIIKDKQEDEPEEKEDEDDSIETDKFKKVDENNMLKYKDAKAEVEIIKNSKVEVENDIKNESDDSNLKDEFKKIEEKNISNYKEVKDNIKKIEEEKENLQNVEETKEIKLQDDVFNETEASKIEEKNIFNYKESKILIESIKENVEIEDKKVDNTIEQEDEFKKVEENNIFKYTDAKLEVDNIKNDNNDLENKTDIDEIEDDNLLINNDENKFYKIEEKNINDNISARKEIEEITKKNEELKKKYKLEIKEYQQITNNLKTIIETKCKTKNRVSKGGTNVYDNVKREVNPPKIKTFVKIADSSISEVLYGKVKFSKPVIKIIDIRGYVTFKNINLIKSSYKTRCEDSVIMYDGTVRVDLQYLEDTKIHCSNIDAVPKYYLMYIPFSGSKSVIIDDEEFINEKYINDKISIDIKSSEFAYDTSLQGERCIGPYIKVYKECEIFIIMECNVDILMKKIIESI